MKRTRFDYFLDQIEQMKANPTDECIEWLYTKNKAGYGLVYSPIKKKVVLVHREVLEQIDGEPPEVACHICRNRACWNYHHLYDGTAYHNSADRVVMDRLGDTGESLSAPERAMVIEAIKQRYSRVPKEEKPSQENKDDRHLEFVFGYSDYSLRSALVSLEFIENKLEYTTPEFDEALQDARNALWKVFDLLHILPYPRSEMLLWDFLGNRQPKR